jgi:hypothetical protein
MSNQNTPYNRFDMPDDVPDPVAEDNDLPLGPDRREALGYVGQLVQKGDGDVDDVDDESNTVALDEGFGTLEDQSAEEAAMHTVDEP